MTLNAALWARLEDHGVTVAHMEMLLRALETHGNGSIAWHYSHGQMSQIDLRILTSARRADIARMTDAMLDEGTSLLR